MISTNVYSTGLSHCICTFICQTSHRTNVYTFIFTFAAVLSVHWWGEDILVCQCESIQSFVDRNPVDWSVSKYSTHGVKAENMSPLHHLLERKLGVEVSAWLLPCEQPGCSARLPIGFLPVGQWGWLIKRCITASAHSRYRWWICWCLVAITTLLRKSIPPINGQHPQLMADSYHHESLKEL